MSFDSKTIDISATSNDKNGKDNKGNGADIGQSTGQKNGKNGGDAENNRVSSIVGGINSAKCVVRTDEEVKVVVDNIFAKLKNRFVTVGTTTWGMQFREAMTVGADVDEHGISHPPSNFDYTMHFFSLFWKVLFAFVPPTSYYGGWATFTVALVFIGALTAIIGELASLFGCVIGLKDSVTAITFVALGTSLPDTFASKQAAEECPDADSSVGNITGSNSVNVFLGLGLPWIIASVYNYMNDDPYIFPAGSLGFSVIVFSFTAIVCLGLLVYRQFVSKSVLGGDKTEKTWVAGLFAFLWFVYILLSSMKAYGHIDLF